MFRLWLSLAVLFLAQSVAEPQLESQTETKEPFLYEIENLPEENLPEFIFASTEPHPQNQMEAWHEIYLTDFTSSK